MVSLTKQLTIFYACIPFLFGIFHHVLLYVDGSDFTNNQALPTSQVSQVDDKEPINVLERIASSSDDTGANSLSSDNFITLEDHTLGDTIYVQKDNEDQEKAAEFGITLEEFKSFHGLLKTADINLGDDEKLEESLSGNFSTGQVEETSRDERSSADICPESPEGVDNCIPCNSDPRIRFEHTDDNGFTCQCQMCMKPTYIDIGTPCNCASDGRVQNEPTCVFPKPGYFMSYRNWCVVPFTCKTTCLGDMVIVKDCTVSTDAECGCPDDTDQIGEMSCRPIPTCNVGFESKLDGGETGISLHICKPCQEGYIQPKNDTHDKCYLPQPSSTLSNKQDDEPRLETGTSKPTQDPDTTGNSNQDTSPGTDLLPDNSTTSSSSPTNPTYDDKSGTSIHLMDRWSLAVTWIFTIIIAFMAGYLVCRVGLSTIVCDTPRKFFKWCYSWCCFRSKTGSYQLASSNNNDENKDVSINMEVDTASTSSSNQPVVTFSEDTGRTETDLLRVPRSSPKMTPRRRKGRRNKTI